MSLEAKFFRDEVVAGLDYAPAFVFVGQEVAAQDLHLLKRIISRNWTVCAEETIEIRGLARFSDE